MTTAQDVIAEILCDLDCMGPPDDIDREIAVELIERLCTAPEAVRLELAGKLIPWSLIETTTRDAIASMIAEHGLDGIVCIPRAQYDALTAALEPFASIGQWMFARDLPDNTPVVQIGHIQGKTTALTRGDFKAAHAALRAASIPEI